MLKRKLCNYYIENGLVKENDVIVHSYTRNRLNDSRRIVECNNELPTLSTRGDILGVCVRKMNELRIRKLTPLECWRLMGFDDSDVDKCKAVGISNSQLYKQAGNSIVVNVLVAIFSELLQVKGNCEYE